MEKIMDHLGNTYDTLQEMCEVYGVSVNCYTKRIQRGASKRDALTMPSDKRFYKYNGHIFLCKSGLLAYAGLTERNSIRLLIRSKKYSS